MARYFFDSSSLVKRFAQETGSTWINSLCTVSANNDIHVAAITGVEVIAALVRRKRSSAFQEISLITVIEQFRFEYETRYQAIEISSDLILKAMSMAETHALRGYDAVQLAAAIT